MVKKELPNTNYNGCPISYYNGGPPLANSFIPPKELGLTGLVSDFDSGIIPLSSDGEASLGVGSDIYSFFKMAGGLSVNLLDKFSKSVKCVYEQLYFNMKE